MIRIAFIIDTIESPTAGTEKQLLLLLKNLDRTIFLPTLCVLRSSQWIEREFTLCPVYEANITSFKKPSSYHQLYKLAQYFKNEKIDIVQTYFRDANIAGILAGKLAKVNGIVSSRRDMGYWHNNLELVLLKVVNRWVNCFIVNSWATKEWSIKTEGIPEKKIRVIYNGIDLRGFEKVSAETTVTYRNHLEIPQTAPVIGIVANLRPVKGVDLFIRAAQVVMKHYPESHFIIVGDGPDRIALEKLTEDLGLGEHIHFLGKRLDIPEILSIFDIGILSSYSESFSNSIIEYLSAGLPVIATDVGGCRDNIVQNKIDYIVPKGDYQAIGEAILEALKGGHPKNKNNKSNCEDFSIETLLKKTEELYSSLSCNA
jgi:L-malate glycosyltransferase